MAKKICRRLDFKYPESSGKNNWISIPLKADAVLQMDVTNEEAGYLDQNKVTATMLYDPEFPFIKQPEPFVIIRAFTDEGTEIIIGTADYPAYLEYTTDYIVARLTFTQSQPH